MHMKRFLACSAVEISATWGVKFASNTLPLPLPPEIFNTATTTTDIMIIIIVIIIIIMSPFHFHTGPRRKNLESLQLFLSPMSCSFLP